MASVVLIIHECQKKVVIDFDSSMKKSKKNKRFNKKHTFTKCSKLRLKSSPEFCHKRKSTPSFRSDGLQAFYAAGDVGEVPKEQRRELRKMLREDLDRVTSFLSRLETKELQLRSNSHSGSTFFSSDPIVTLSASGKGKRIPRANQMYVNSEFLSGNERMPPPEKLKPEAPTFRSKKNQMKEDGGDLKVQLARNKFMTGIINQCSELLKKVSNHCWAWPFVRPVDVVKYTDYNSIIRRPMDLGTVQRKLRLGQYPSPFDFSEDVQLVFSNAFTYNPKLDDTYKMAEALKEIFDEGWKSIKKRLDEEGLKIRADVLSEQQGENPQLEDLKRDLVKLEDRIMSMSSNTLRGRAAPKRAMTFDEKIKLSSDIEKLPDKSEEILQIIRKRNLRLNQSQVGNVVEVEVDINFVDNETLWELHGFVTSCMKNTKNSRKTPTEGKPIHHMQAAKNRENVFTPSIHNQKSDVGEEDVDIDDDIPMAQFSPVIVDKDAIVDASNTSSSSSSSSDSGSASSDSDSRNSSGSESAAGDVRSGCPDQNFRR